MHAEGALSYICRNIIYTDSLFRYRFTAALVAQLLRSSFQSPHKILNAYVEGFSGFCPTDGLQFVDKEAFINAENMIPHLTLDFSKFKNGTYNIVYISLFLISSIFARRQ